MKANEKEWLSWALIYINDVRSFVKPRSIAKLKSYINTACICFWIFQNGHNDWIGADTHSALSKVGVDRKKTFQHISFHLPAITFFYGNLSVIITFWRFSFSFSLYLSLLFYLVIVFVFVALPCNCISIFDVYLVIVFIYLMFTLYMRKISLIWSRVMLPLPNLSYSYKKKTLLISFLLKKLLSVKKLWTVFLNPGKILDGQELKWSW